MNIKKTKYGKKAERVDFSRISSKLEIPNLLDIQIKSFEWFLNEGIKEIFDTFFPITKEDQNDTVLMYVNHKFKEGSLSLEKAMEKDASFSKPLYVNIELLNGKTGEVVNREVYFGEIPMMTPKGTFVINGAERVIVPQLVRSAGPHYYQSKKPTKIIEEYIMVPTRGSWIEFEIPETEKNAWKVEADKKPEKFWIKLDRSQKLLVPTFLLAIGLPIEKQKEFFSHSKLFVNSLNDIPEIQKDIDNTSEAQKSALIETYHKMKPGEPGSPKLTSMQLINTYFDGKKYDLGKVGRFKFNTKLSAWRRIEGTYLAEDLKLQGKVVLKKGTFLVDKNFKKAKEYLQKGANLQEIDLHNELVTHSKQRVNDKNQNNVMSFEKVKLQVISVYKNEESKNNEKNKIIVVGNYQDETIHHITISYIIACFSYLVNIKDRICSLDNVDDLENRRIKHVGELVQNQFRSGLARIEKNVIEKISSTNIDFINMTAKKIININPLTSAINEFFLTSQLSQFMDQTNPQSELSNKRRISSLGPGGLSRSYAGAEIRDVKPTYYGRICPIETPEGLNVGLINNLAIYSKINQYGFIETPYFVVSEKNGEYYVTNKVKYLTAGLESEAKIAYAGIKIDDKGKILENSVVARHKGTYTIAKKEEIDYIDVSPQQILSIASACIPFLEHDDATRAAMGANMQRQAVPLLFPKSPIVGTGLEHIAAKFSGLALICKEDGEVIYTDSRKIIVQGKKHKKEYKLLKFKISNQGTLINQTTIVQVGDKVEKGDIIADGPSMEKGELALGANVTVAFTTWNGYNYEDAIIISERLVKDDVYTSIHISEYKIDSRTTPQGDEEITRDLPNVSLKQKQHLDEDGIIRVGTEVKQGDILVGKTSPKIGSLTSPEEKLLHAIFGEKSKNKKESSLRVPHGVSGIVQKVKILTSDKNKKLPLGINKTIKVYIAQKRKIQEGDKMAGRHGNKGVISIVLPEEDMPILPNGKPVDILLNPLGVPSRMNIGQILEIHLGMAAKESQFKVATPAFDGCSIKELQELMKDAGLNEGGKVNLRDGRSGEFFDKPISIGIMYILKLSHMVDDKIHARATGPYSVITQQPLGGKAQNGGQRFGEMEVWALEAYGAAYTLREMLTIKSDDILGRSKTYQHILKGEHLSQPNLPESFLVLQKELQALSLSLEYNTEGEK